MAKSIVGIANSRNQVEDTVDDLQSAVSSTDISLLMPESGGTPELGAVKATKAPEGATTGAVAGGAIGGIVGLLAGIVRWLSRAWDRLSLRAQSWLH